MAQDNNGYDIQQEKDEHMAFTPNEYTGTIWQFLKDNSGFTDEGVAAIMGNMWAESGCTPYACQPSRPKNVCLTYIEKVDNDRITEYQFVHGGCSANGDYTSTQLGFGLCQWTVTSRKQGLHDKVFPNYPNMESHSIGNIYYQLEYIIDEIYSGSFNSVKNILTTSHSLNDCSDIVLEVYENPLNQSQAVHELRRQYTSEVFAIYGTASGNYIIVSTTGDGTAYVDNPNPLDGASFTLYATPASGETLQDITARDSHGYSIAMQVVPQYTYTYNETSWGNYINIYVEFSGTPPIPPTPTLREEHSMPIWMYPHLRRKV